MTSVAELPTSVLNRRTRRTVLVLALVYALVIVTALSAHAQTFSVIYDFTGGQDGATPTGGITLDQAGRLYGTTSTGGDTAGNCTDGHYLQGCGTVFQLKRANSGWVFNLLYSFAYTDGAAPEAGVVFGPNGLLYGTTSGGGILNEHFCTSTGCGVIFSLRPPATVCKTVLCPWTETVLYKFTGGHTDGFVPLYGNVIFDQSGNLYDTNIGDEAGVVYELSPEGSGWTFSPLYYFLLPPAPGCPMTGVIFDSAGNLYGTAPLRGPYGGGVIYELTPAAGLWTFTDVHAFTGGSDGSIPFAAPIRDSSGNFYGTTTAGGVNGGGTIYELTPSNGGWTFTTLYSFSGSEGPRSALTMDASGSLYGTTVAEGAYGYGNVFKLSPANGGWTYTSVYDFTGGTDGGIPIGNMSIGSNGNLYGTASKGGASNHGVAWEITP